MGKLQWSLTFFHKSPCRGIQYHPRQLASTEATLRFAHTASTSDLRLSRKRGGRLRERQTPNREEGAGENALLSCTYVSVRDANSPFVLARVNAFPIAICSISSVFIRIISCRVIGEELHPDCFLRRNELRPSKVGNDRSR